MSVNTFITIRCGCGRKFVVVTQPKTLTEAVAHMLTVHADDHCAAKHIDFECHCGSTYHAIGKSDISKISDWLDKHASHSHN